MNQPTVYNNISKVDDNLYMLLGTMFEAKMLENLNITYIYDGSELTNQIVNDEYFRNHCKYEYIDLESEIPINTPHYMRPAVVSNNICEKMLQSSSGNEKILLCVKQEQFYSCIMCRYLQKKYPELSGSDILSMVFKF